MHTLHIFLPSASPISKLVPETGCYARQTCGQRQYRHFYIQFYHELMKQGRKTLYSSMGQAILRPLFVDKILLAPKDRLSVQQLLYSSAFPILTHGKKHKWWQTIARTGCIIKNSSVKLFSALVFQFLSIPLYSSVSLQSTSFQKKGCEVFLFVCKYGQLYSKLYKNTENTQKATQNIWQ